ncbi:MAG: prephenate dehydratase [Bacteroidales bacterium]|nr:prephenate dehydratase [Bacteroidales bacterium]
MKRLAIQGYRGCFHEEAARLFYAARGEEEPEIVECDTFEDLYRAMEAGRADAMVMAIENTVSGGLIRNFELLRSHEAKIKGEVYLRIEQNLMALPGQKLEDIREVRTHYMAINQTRDFFEKGCPWIKVVESEDTAKSAAEVAREGLKGIGAVASALAAQLYGLEILRPGIETYKENFTRFVILDPALEIEPSGIDKASICFTLAHEVGSLSAILTILSFYGMNLTRIQSLPIPGKQWQYFFYVDIKFGSYDRYSQALSAIMPLVEGLKILGEYKSAI